MATVMNGFLGDAIGKLGNVVFRKWNSLITVSKYQPMVNNPNTLAQQAQRQKIKNLSLALKPFKDSLIPLNFKNRKGRSTSWAEAIRANYPLLDDSGNINFNELILSGGNLVPPVIIKATYDAFINQFGIKYSLINADDIDNGCIRLTAVGRKPMDTAFNTENICKLPFKNYFSTYINEVDPPDWPLFYDFNNFWSEGKLFYNIISDPERDVRNYIPANIINRPSVGIHFNSSADSSNFNFNITDRIILPEYIYASVYQDAIGWKLKISIDDYTKYPNLNADDIVCVMLQILEPNANSYDGAYSFPASSKSVSIPLTLGDQEKPFNFLYFVNDPTGKNKTTITRFGLNHPDSCTYCELLFKNGLIHPDSVKIHEPFTAIWGDLKDFIPGDLIDIIPYKILSNNTTTNEIREHAISSDFLFFCSKLLRNQIYTITIMDGETVATEFDVVGIDDHYDASLEKNRPRKIIRFKAGNELASKVK